MAKAGASDERPCFICTVRPRLPNFSYCLNCARDRQKISAPGAARCMRVAYEHLGTDVGSAAAIAYATRLLAASQKTAQSPRAAAAAEPGEADAATGENGPARASQPAAEGTNVAEAAREEAHNAGEEAFCGVCRFRKRADASRHCVVCKELRGELRGQGALQCLRAAYESLGRHAASADILAFAQQLLQWSLANEQPGSDDSTQDGSVDG